VSPVRWLADVFLSFIGALFFIKNDGREFLVTLLEVNSTRVQSDILNRIQESHGHLEVEIRKLLHEVSRVAEQALSNARRVREEGASAVETARERLGTLEREVLTLGDDAVPPSPT
jgi:polyhydroxyalkanoate synthesis regulator phasin